MSQSNDWYENDEFWRRTYPFMFSEERFAAAAEVTDGLLAALQLAPGGTLLDLCSGPGRFAIPIAQRGVRVTAVDRTRFYLDRLTARAADTGVQIETVHESMLTFRRECAFDGVINMYTSFGYFENKDDDWTVLENVYSSLKPGGRFVMAMMGREVAARIYQHHDWLEQDGCFLLEERRVDPDFGGTHDRWIVIDNDGQWEFEWALRLYTGTELAEMLRAAGFSEAGPFADFEGTPYDNRAGRLVMIARK